MIFNTAMTQYIDPYLLIKIKTQLA